MKQQEFLAELARRGPDGELYLRDEAACALRVPPATTAHPNYPCPNRLPSPSPSRKMTGRRRSDG